MKQATTFKGGLSKPYLNPPPPPPPPPPEASPPRDGLFKFRCEYCIQVFDRKFNLELHRRTHTGDKPFHCVECPKAFASSSNLYRHVRTVHAAENETQSYTCDDCGATFTQSAALKRHVSTIHHGERKYVCTDCGKSFKQAHHLAQHEKQHTQQKSYGCGICNRLFLDQANLHKHMRTHTDSKPFECNECGRHFRQKHHLQEHLKTHQLSETGERSKDHVCPTCEKSFQTASGLWKHRASHMRLGTRTSGAWKGYRPFVCDECSEGFSSARDLTIHSRKHTESHGKQEDDCAIQLSIDEDVLYAQPSEPRYERALQDTLSNLVHFKRKREEGRSGCITRNANIK